VSEKSLKFDFIHRRALNYLIAAGIYLTIELTSNLFVWLGIVCVCMKIRCIPVWAILDTLVGVFSVEHVSLA
jgi:hypothetical protein